jgi:protein-arginine kinase activator protein McsA
MRNFFYNKEMNELINEFLNNPSFYYPSFLGDYKSESGQNENGEWLKQTYSSKDGSVKIVKFYQSNESEDNNTESNDLTKLKKELEKSIEKQDFENAVILRDKIKKHEKNTKKITDLEKELQSLIETQNFEKAIEIRDELNKLKSK